MNSFYPRDILNQCLTEVFCSAGGRAVSFGGRKKKDSFLEKKEESREQMEINGEKKIKYDFTPNGVDLKSFPYNTWRKLSREILSDDRTELFRLGDPRGEYEFRSVICRYLYQARGVNCTPEQVIVGAGSDYLMMLFAPLSEEIM